MNRKPYSGDVSDDEWSFVALYLALIDEQVPQRRYSLREVFNALRWLTRAGAPLGKVCRTPAAAGVEI